MTRLASVKSSRRTRPADALPAHSRILSDLIARVVADKLGMDPATSTPEAFARIVASDYAKWGPIVKASGFTAD